MLDRQAIIQAAGRTLPHVRRTPVLRAFGRDFGLTDRPDLPVTLKLEMLQHTASFKPRGAFNRMLNETPPHAGVIAASGGNHGAAVAYAARHLGMSSVRGQFDEFGGTVEVAHPVERSSVTAVIQAASIDTANKMRDDHLRSKVFLDVEHNPVITYRSTGLAQLSEERWAMDGELTAIVARRPLFASLLIGTVILIGVLNYVPALALGPVVEHFALSAGPE